MSNFKAGDKVVVIDDSGINLAKPIRKGDIHCIRGCRFVSGSWGVTLVGVENKWNTAWGVEQGYLASRFRLVSEVKLIMSAVRESKKPETVEAQ